MRRAEGLEEVVSVLRREERSMTSGESEGKEVGKCHHSTIATRSNLALKRSKTSWAIADNRQRLIASNVSREIKKLRKVEILRTQVDFAKLPKPTRHPSSRT